MRTVAGVHDLGFYVFGEENPGAGMPPSVQTGYSPATGFVIRSAPNPKYINWDDDCKIPFELRIHGRLQLAYYYYKVTDRVNHLTNIPASQNASSSGVPGSCVSLW